MTVIAALSRKFPPGRTKVRIGRVVSAAWTRVNGRAIARVDLPAGTFLLDVRSRTEAEMIWNGRYDADEVAFLAAATPDDGVFVDIGANVGLVLIQLLNRCALSRAVAVEPIAVNFARLKESVALAETAGICSLRQVALGAEGGELELGKEGGESVSDNAGVGFGGIVEKVPMMTLDDLSIEEGLERLDSMKIDVEGFEAHVFRGGRSAIERFRPVVYGEFNNEYMPRLGTSFLDVWEVFRDLDYVACGFDSATAMRIFRKPYPSLGNAALIPRERLDALREAGYRFTTDVS